MNPISRQPFLTAQPKARPVTQAPRFGTRPLTPEGKAQQIAELTRELNQHFATLSADNVKRPAENVFKISTPKGAYHITFDKNETYLAFKDQTLSAHEATTALSYNRNRQVSPVEYYNFETSERLGTSMDIAIGPVETLFNSLKERLTALSLPPTKNETVSL